MTASGFRSVAVVMVALIFLSLAGMPGPAAAAPPLVTLPISGTTSGNGAFSGTLAVSSVVTVGRGVFVEGVVSGTVTRPNGRPIGTVVSATVRLPLSGNWPSGLASLAPERGRPSSQREIVLAQASCGILNLEIGSITLNVLGVVVTTSPIALDISGDTAGPLGSLVCSILNLVGSLAGLVNLLTSLLGALGGAVGGALPAGA